MKKNVARTASAVAVRKTDSNAIPADLRQWLEEHATAQKQPVAEVLKGVIARYRETKETEALVDEGYLLATWKGYDDGWEQLIAYDHGKRFFLVTSLSDDPVELSLRQAWAWWHGKTCAECKAGEFDLQSNFFMLFQQVDFSLRALERFEKRSQSQTEENAIR